MCKRYCNNIDIFTFETVVEAHWRCLMNKMRRGDVRNYLLGKGVHNPQKRYKYNKSLNTDLLYFEELINIRSRELLQELKSGKLKLAPIQYEVRYDNNSRKNRNIAIQSIKQQICDYLALIGLSPFFCYIGKYQVAGIPGRGTHFGIKALRKWLGKYKTIYAGKFDIRKCYESIDHDKLMNFLYKHIKNNNLLWLIKTLISTYDKGVSIGSILSQYLCTLYLAQLYHEIMENMYIIEGNTRINLVEHTLFQMDDILILCKTQKYAELAVQKIRQIIQDMGLQFKNNFDIFRVARGKEKISNKIKFIDIMGYRFYSYNTKVTLRRNTYKKARRCALRTYNVFRRKVIPCIERARRVVSLLGRFKDTDSIVAGWLYLSCFNKCKGVISRYDKNKILGRAACG